MSEPKIQASRYEPAGPLARVAGAIVRSPSIVWSIVIVASVFVMVAGTLLLVRQVPLLSPGQTAPATRVVRVGFEIEDKVSTDAARQAAAERSPRVYVLDPQVVLEVRQLIEKLPVAVGDVLTLDQVSLKYRAQFEMSEAQLSALRRTAADPALLEQWQASAKRLDAALRSRPLISSAEYQDEQLQSNSWVELVDSVAASLAVPGTAKPTALNNKVVVPSQDVLLSGSPKAMAAFRDMASRAGFVQPMLDGVVAKLAGDRRPNYVFDEQASLANGQAAANAVEPRTVKVPVGQVLMTFGEKLDGAKIHRFELERAAYHASLPAWQRWSIALATLGVAAIVTGALAAFVRTYSPAMLREPRRFGLIGGLVGFGLALSCLAAAADPRLLPAAIVTPAVLVAMVIAVGFDRRLALVLGTLTAITACVALEQPVGLCAVALGGVGAVAWTLRELRTRNALIRTGLVAAIAVASGVLLLSVLLRPLTQPAIVQALWEAATAAVGVLMCGFLILGLLPVIERILAITTGLTLIELRDPKHPLLRQLQQQAPGTYNHSLNVASLAEAAAEAINADGLLAYVGALYHDVGKMNKPEYFAENQTPGINRHDRLTPAMSLLVIVSHVRDGIELANEHNLPQTLLHFIEAHHGTTLVEYFYHRARKQAEATAGSAAAHAQPVELEYRYPGPRPRTKEAAILMVCDAAESATRTLADPSATRIESLVRAIAHKRLMDGQFDDSDLTLHELNRVVEAVSRTLAAIHHQRVIYPDGPAGPARSGQGRAETRSNSPKVAAVGAV